MSSGGRVGEQTSHPRIDKSPEVEREATHNNVELAHRLGVVMLADVASLLDVGGHLRERNAGVSANKAEKAPDRAFHLPSRTAICQHFSNP